MKAFFYTILVVTSLLFCNEISAQFGNGFGNGNGMMNRRMGNGMDQTRQPEKPKEIPTEVTVGKIMERLSPELTLDELQKIAIGNILTESIKTQGMLIKAEVSQEDKMNNIKVLSETTDKKILDLLNPAQKEKFIAINNESKNPKKLNPKRKKSNT